LYQKFAVSYRKIRDAIRIVVPLLRDGFLGRNSDGEPGTKSMWLGLQRLKDITAIWKIMASNSILKNQSSPRVQNPRYG
jgi:hypothetical protein